MNVSSLLLADNKQPIFIQEVLRFAIPPIVNFLILVALFLSVYDYPKINNDGAKCSIVFEVTAEDRDTNRLNELPCSLRKMLNYASEMTEDSPLFSQTNLTESLEDVSNVIGGAAFAAGIALLVMVFVCHEIVKRVGWLIGKIPFFSLKFNRVKAVDRCWNFSEKNELQKSGSVSIGLFRLAMQAANSELVAGSRGARETLERKVSFWEELNLHVLGIAVVGVPFVSLAWMTSDRMYFNLTSLLISIFVVAAGFILVRFFYFSSQIHLLQYDRAVFHFLNDLSEPSDLSFNQWLIEPSHKNTEQ